jgi:PncC family amidohydrolase
MDNLNQKSEELGKILRAKNLTLVVAESCTGGLVGHTITNTPGSSDYFLGGVITYSDESKIELLSVSEETIKKYGAVSAECVKEMVSGVKRILRSDIGLAISGIAGPGGGTEEKPVGTVFVAIEDRNGNEWYQFNFEGSRIDIKEQSCLKALELLIERSK